MADAERTDERSARTLAQLRHWLPSRWAPALLSVLSLIAGLMEAAVVAGVAAVAASIAQSSDTIDVSVGPLSVDSEISSTLLVLFAATLIMVGLRVTHSFLAARLAADTLRYTRARLVREYLASPYETQRSYVQAELHELVVIHAMRLTQAASAVIGAMSQGLAFVAMVSVAFLADPASAAVLLVLAGVLAFFFRPLMRVSSRAGEAHISSQTEVAVRVGEVSDLLAEIRVFDAQAGMRDRMDVGIEHTAKALRTASFARGLMPTLYLGAILVALLLGVYFLHTLGSFDAATVGAVVLLTLRGMRYSQAALSQVQTGVELSKNVAVVVRESERFLAENTDDQGDTLERIDSLVCEQVTYQYPNSSEGVESVSLTCRRGETIGIAGHSGAGKSTFAELLLGLRHPTSGQILVNGRPREDYRLGSWYARVAYVGQEPRLLAGNVASNVRFFRDVPDEMVGSALEQASLTDDLERWGGRDGRDVGSGGRDISGGQRQRIAIARAVAGHPDLVVMDEPTSALDDASEVQIRAAIRTMASEAIVFVIAHRQSTLEVCDRVIEFRNGVATEVPVTAAAAVATD